MLPAFTLWLLLGFLGWCPVEDYHTFDECERVAREVRTTGTRATCTPDWNGMP